MTTQTQSRKYPLLLAEYAFDLACEYGWKPKVTNWHKPFIQAIEPCCGGRCEGYNEDFVDIGDLPENDRTDIANALEQASNDVPDEVVQVSGYNSEGYEYMSSSLYEKSLFYKLVFWSEHKADLKEFIQLLRQGANQLSQP